ncbi:hypothetical protein E4U43_004177 [Claviceps pusilla]|uniref:Uncharacterized protein n=1 Tax=Claviceps pusilla TaxID=123648 RepID=A0A9P7NFC4_9HYPO|nr:hypothetical protein E4U43_004177 [Claviceps pusilla]
MASTSACESAGTKTPPPGASIRTPPAPRLGFNDSWEPFSPRKSARLSSQRAAADRRTPSPVASTCQQLRSPRTAKKAIVHSNKLITSPMASPRKRSQPALDPRRQASGSLTAEGTANAAAALGLNTEKRMHTSAGASISQAAGMLPTPSKTPRKPPNEKTAKTIQSFARNLFSSDQQPVPSPQKKRSKKYSGVTLESFTAEEEEEHISIFTDSQDRIPERDESESNPFYGNSASRSSKKQSKRRVVHIPGEGMQSLDEVSRRDDGMVYVFRGKRFFRKFAEQDQPEDQIESLGEDDDGSQISRPLTRSSVQPRLLFPTPKMTEEDEEALTDVEDMNIAESAPQTPRKPQSLSTKTPEAPRFAPASPPDTRRTTRSANKLSETPMKAAGRKSPFDSWPRTKEHKTQLPVTKRSGESLASAATKRSRA